jgi:hypothetical protein
LYQLIGANLWQRFIFDLPGALVATKSTSIALCCLKTFPLLLQLLAGEMLVLWASLLQC